MKISEFWFVMEHEFGKSYSRVLARDLVLQPFGELTAQEALEAGIPVRDIWWAICDAQDIPESRRFGPDHEPRQGNKFEI